MLSQSAELRRLTLACFIYSGTQLCFVAFTTVQLVSQAGFGLIESWKAARRPVEFHLYEQGGHGFGMYPKETTSTGWFDAFVRWLEMHGMAKPAGSGN